MPDASDSAAYRPAPGPANAVTLATAGSVYTASTTITGGETFVEIQADGGKMFYRFGATSISAATKTDFHVEDGEKEAYIKGNGAVKLRVLSTVSGVKLKWAKLG